MVMAVTPVLRKGREYLDQMSNYQPFEEDVGVLYEESRKLRML